MKLSNPKSREALSIKRRYNVLEVGPGNHPHKRSNVLLDKFVDDNYHRAGDLKILKHQRFVEGDGETLPFKDKEFDYLICCHVLEHVTDPIKFLKEQSRVAGMGYLETPSIIGEYLMPKESHRWVIQEIDGKIVMYEKEKINFHISSDMGYIFQEYLPKNSIGYKIMERTHRNLTVVNYEWKDDIDVLVNPDSTYYSDFFTKPFREDMFQKLMPNRSLKTELANSILAIGDIITSVVKSKLLKALS